MKPSQASDPLDSAAKIDHMVFHCLDRCESSKTPLTVLAQVLDGVACTGIITGITKRATVLVEDDQGLPYSNGKRYAKFYVPVQALEVVD